jgi:hypothetical protein
MDIGKKSLLSLLIMCEIDVKQSILELAPLPEEEINEEN